MTPFNAGPLAEVRLVHADGRPALVFTRTFRHTPDAVWTALTSPTWLEGWAPFDADRSLGLPGPTTLHLVDGTGSVDVPAEVLRSQAPSYLEYDWGADRLVWELERVPFGARLTLTHVLGSREQAPKMAAGWHICLAVAERLLDGDPVGRIAGSAARAHGWDTLRGAYAQVLDIPDPGWPTA